VIGGASPEVAHGKRVAGVVGRTGADRNAVADVALRVVAAHGLAFVAAGVLAVEIVADVVLVEAVG